MSQKTSNSVLFGRRIAVAAIRVGLLAAIMTAAAAAAPVSRYLAIGNVPPEMISYQGFVRVSGSAFDGTGYFKFAIVDAASGDGAVNYWANDGTLSGEPAAEMALTVTDGLFDVLLGDTSIAGMSTTLGSSAFADTRPICVSGSVKFRVAPFSHWIQINA